MSVERPCGVHRSPRSDSLFSELELAGTTRGPAAGSPARALFKCWGEVPSSVRRSKPPRQLRIAQVPQGSVWRAHSFARTNSLLILLFPERSTAQTTWGRTPRPPGGAQLRSFATIHVAIVPGPSLRPSESPPVHAPDTLDTPPQTSAPIPHLPSESSPHPSPSRTPSAHNMRRVPFPHSTPASRTDAPGTPDAARAPESQTSPASAPRLRLSTPTNHTTAPCRSSLPTPDTARFRREKVPAQAPTSTTRDTAQPAATAL